MNTPVPPDENVRFAEFQVVGACEFPLLVTNVPLSPLEQPKKLPVNEVGAFTGLANAGAAPASVKAQAAAKPAAALRTVIVISRPPLNGCLPRCSSFPPPRP
jgi:hypothetical protein